MSHDLSGKIRFQSGTLTDTAHLSSRGRRYRNACRKESPKLRKQEDQIGILPGWQPSIQTADRMSCQWESSTWTMLSISTRAQRPVKLGTLCATLTASSPLQRTTSI